MVLIYLRTVCKPQRERERERERERARYVEVPLVRVVGAFGGGTVEGQIAP